MTQGRSLRGGLQPFGGSICQFCPYICQRGNIESSLPSNGRWSGRISEKEFQTSKPLLLVYFGQGFACSYLFVLWCFNASTQSRLIIHHNRSFNSCRPAHQNLWLLAPFVPPIRAGKPTPRSYSTLPLAISGSVGIQKPANLSWSVSEWGYIWATKDSETRNKFRRFVD